MVHLRHYNPPHRIFGNPPLINQPNIQDSFSASLSYYASIIKLSKAESLSPPTEQASYSALGGFCRHKEHSVVWDFPIISPVASHRRSAWHPVRIDGSTSMSTPFGHRQLKAMRSAYDSILNKQNRILLLILGPNTVR